jgi:mono/diheme cytochrome c family protein
MNYPFWDVGIGYGVIMAIVAVVHVFVSHFAIGGGLYLVVTERAARKANDTERLAFLQKLSKFFIMVTLPFGTLSGVGIWFVIGVLSPAGTETLIHNFVWGWATEWTFFAVEIASALLYYYGWKRMSAKDHMAIGWIYFVTAWLSLVIINGILTFMLTPGDWLKSGNFWDGFFNATYWPGLFFRTGICVMLAGIYALMVASREKGPGRLSLIRYNAAWGIVGLAIMVPTFYWYFHAIPAELMTKAMAVMATPIHAMYSSFWLAGIVGVLVLLFGVLLPRQYQPIVGAAVMALGLLWFGEFEWFRESLRKPYVISGFMYGNGVEVSKVPNYQQVGMLEGIRYRTSDITTDLFDHACRSCHTLNGYKPLLPALEGASPAFTLAVVKGTALLKGNMPPFAGTETEAKLIAGYLFRQADHRPLHEIYGTTGEELGEMVYTRRCACCHVVGSPDDKTKTLPGQTAQDYSDLLDQAESLGEGMPAFLADSTDRMALITYLTSLKAGGTDDSTRQ